MRVKFPVTIHLFLLSQDQVLLLRRFQTGYMDGCYSLPAGHLDGNEPLREAGSREALEELGLLIQPEDLDFCGVFHRAEGDERVDFFFKAQSWVGEPHNAEPHKCDDLRWFAINNLPDNLVPYIRLAIRNYQAGIPFSEVGWK